MGTEPGQLTWAGQRDVLHDVMPRPAITNWLAFSPKMSITQWLAGHSSASGGGEWLPVHHLFLFLFALLLKLSCSQPVSFLIFALPLLSPCQWRVEGGERAPGWGAAGWGQPTLTLNIWCNNLTLKLFHYFVHWALFSIKNVTWGCAKLHKKQGTAPIATVLA